MTPVATEDQMISSSLPPLDALAGAEGPGASDVLLWDASQLVARVSGMGAASSADECCGSCGAPG